MCRNGELGAALPLSRAFWLWLSVFWRNGDDTSVLPLAGEDDW